MMATKLMQRCHVTYSTAVKLIAKGRSNLGLRASEPWTNDLAIECVALAMHHPGLHPRRTALPDESSSSRRSPRYPKRRGPHLSTWESRLFGVEHRPYRPKTNSTVLTETGEFTHVPSESTTVYTQSLDDLFEANYGPLDPQARSRRPWVTREDFEEMSLEEQIGSLLNGVGMVKQASKADNMDPNHASIRSIYAPASEDGDEGDDDMSSIEDPLDVRNKKTDEDAKKRADSMLRERRLFRSLSFGRKKEQVVLERHLERRGLFRSKSFGRSLLQTPESSSPLTKEAPKTPKRSESFRTKEDTTTLQVETSTGPTKGESLDELSHGNSFASLDKRSKDKPTLPDRTESKKTLRQASGSLRSLFRNQKASSKKLHREARPEQPLPERRGLLNRVKSGTLRNTPGSRRKVQRTPSLSHYLEKNEVTQSSYSTDEDLSLTVSRVSSRVSSKASTKASGRRRASPRPPSTFLQRTLSRGYN